MALRWRVNLARWTPGVDEDTLHDLAAALPPVDAAAVRAFARPADRARALVSRHLQRAAVAAALGVGRDAVVVGRSIKGNKPYVAAPAAAARPSTHPNALFSVSHDGPWVVLALHPLLLVGVDVASPRPGGPRGAAALRAAFASSLSPREWATVAAAPSLAAQDAAFRRHWALKEAFVKARGDGVATELGAYEFSIAPGRPPSLSLNGVPAPDWAFDVVDLPDGAALATALGPPSAALDAGGTLRASLGRAAVAGGDLEDGLAGGWPAWVDMPVGNVLPDAF